MTEGREPESRPATPLRSVALASISPRRRQLLESLGLEVVQIKSSYREDDHLDAHRDPRDLVLAHAQGKARLAQTIGPPVLVTADTEVVIDGDVLGKPCDPAEAKAMLARLAGRTHTVHTGFAVVDRASGKTISGVESARVTFEPLSATEIARYVATGEPLDKAGAYGIQGRGALLVASIDGDFYTVMGLPLARLGRAFASLGYEVL
jgi:septum formation protein